MHTKSVTYACEKCVARREGQELERESVYVESLQD